MNTRTIDPTTAQMPVVYDFTDCELYKFCEDDVMSEISTYDFFQCGPDYLVPAGTKLRIDHLWGYDAEGRMTEAADWELTIPKDHALKYVVAIMIYEYHKSVESGRFYFIEQAQYENGVLVITTGT